MAALPYIQLYVADYLADTAHLTAAQHGAYLLLIMNYWQRGHALNNSNERLTNVARMTSEEWAKAKLVLQEFFEVDGETWIHHRIEADLEAVRTKSTKASSAGKASAKAKLNKRSTNAQQTLNHTDTDTDTDKEESKALVRQVGRFEEFWSAYPVKAGKKPCAALWKSRGLDSHADKIIANVEIRKRHDPKWLQGFCPHPKTYLNQDRWTDEPAEQLTGNHDDERDKNKPESLADQALRRLRRIANNTGFSGESAPHGDANSALVEHGGGLRA